MRDDASAGTTPTLFADRASPLARRLLVSHGLRESAEPAAADLLWIRKGYGALHERLSPHQVLNHLPGERELVDKLRLTRALRRHAAARPDGPARLAAFFPETWCLDDAGERERFFASLPPEDSPERLWIVKPDRGAEGEGIRILWNLDELRARYRATRPPDDPWIIQRYLDDPLLVGGCKTALRLFVLVASGDPLRVLLHPDGFVRINAAPYRRDAADLAAHLTNTRQQREHPGYDPARQVWTLSELEEHLGRDAGGPGAGFVEERLLPRVVEALRFVFRAAQEALARGPRQGAGFALLGVDWLLDAELRPWLLELQVNPGLKHLDPAKSRIIPPLLGETAALVLELRDRRRAGEEPTRLDRLGRFRWVLNDAEAAPDAASGGADR